MLNESAQTELTETVSGRDVALAGALCYRRNESGGVEILFVGSRRTVDGAFRRGTSKVVRSAAPRR